MSDLAITAAGHLGANGDDAKRLRKAADQMEGMFLDLLFKQLDEAKAEGEAMFGDTPASEQFDQLFHNALSEKASGSLGIADVVFKQLAVKAGLKLSTDPAVKTTGVKP